MNFATNPTRPRRLPLGLLGMLVLVGAVELVLAGRRLDFTTVWADDWRTAAVSATRKASGRDILCFGDSLIKIGVLPKVIEAKTGLKAFNLATNAGTVPSTYFLLRRALEAGARPRAIVVDFFPLMQPDQPRNSTRFYPDLATTGECLELARVAGDADFFTTVLLGKLLPSFKCRYEIRASIKAALAGRRASPWPDQGWIWAAWKSEDGAQPMPSTLNRSPADPRFVGDVSPEGWSCDGINAVYLERFLELARSRSIPVYWLMPPVSPEVQAQRDRNHADEAYDRFARTTLDRHPEVVVLDARHSGYDGQVFIDAIHLDRQGATTLSNDLAGHLGSGTSRWVALPAFASQTEGVARLGEVGKRQK